MKLADFCKEYKFSVTPYQEKLLELLTKNTKQVVSYRAGKTTLNNEFTCAKLMMLKTGDVFVLCSPAGVRKFKLIEIQETLT
jgi:hypothetical protein